LHLHRAERADGLVDALGDVLAAPLDDPMAAEIVSVPTRGIERWLTQQLSSRLGVAAGRADGVCANIQFPFPGRLVGASVAVAAGIDSETDPWLPERAVWPLLDVIEGCLGEPWLGDLAAHLGGTGPDQDPVRRTRRFATARHIADLYDRYGVHRPEMLLAWAAGHDTAGHATAGHATTGHWQAQLWRQLRDRLATPSPAERLAGACARLRAHPEIVELPDRMSLFGLTRLPASYLDVLRALATERQVHLFLLHPSPDLWERVAKKIAGHSPLTRRVDDPTAELSRNLLLTSWGQDAREMQLVLAAGDGGTVDDHRPVGQPAPTLLGRIQTDVRGDHALPGPSLSGKDGRHLLDPEDVSLQVHACHGRARQVEVIRDAILHRLAEDPTLEARDIIVMCPDIETFAPLIHATFGAGDVNDDDRDDGVPAPARPPDLRVRLADRSLRQTNPVLGVVAELLDLATARLTAAEVLDLAGREPVRRRFRVDDDDLGRVEEWVAATGVRWGFDAAHRLPYKLDQLEANTWRSGLDRVLLGVAMAEEGLQLFGGVLPLDDVDSGAIDLAGRFAEFIDRLEVALDDLRQPKPVGEWVRSIAAAADGLTATSERDSWQRAQLQRILDDVLSEASIGGAGADAGLPLDLALADIRSLLADRLQGRPTVANFRTGHLTICTLVPMRSVPHRVVCLLGLDDGVFPRKTARDGDDLILDDPHIGDRDARSEDRQLLLDAVMAATDSLIITYTGRDERTNAPRPPAVPVGELLDVVDRTCITEDRDGDPRTARELIVRHHPLQPFDVRNFTVGALMPKRPWSFDAVALDGARAMTADRLPAPLFLLNPLTDPPADPVEIDLLVRFTQHPVRAFLRQRLGISVSERSEDAGEGLPIELNPLEQWGVGQRLLESGLAGGSVSASIAVEVARGILPPGALADRILDNVVPTVEALLKEADALVAGGGEPGSIEVNLRLPSGRSLVGTVPDVSGNLLRTVTYSRIGPKHRLTAWVRMLALTAAYPDRLFEAATVGRGRWPAPVTIAHIAPFDGDPTTRQRVAYEYLEALLDLYDRGMREPLPLYCSTSAAYAESVRRGGDAIAAARNAWESAWNYDKEDKEPEHLLVLGGVQSFDEVMAIPLDLSDAGIGPDTTDAGRFSLYAERLWASLLSSEKLVHR
jgi:exodeoxyribonuclease V gamma subunit